ncbi:MAG: putative Na+/H+ antiporter [Deltaproteobacteria bacterium]|nr:putative Na+/H+ antiporter [Deltaproteobacteria bacterium]
MLATVLLVIAVVHSFFIKQFQHWAKKFRQGSVGENFFHLMGEIEVAFGLWAAVFISLSIGIKGYDKTVRFLEARDFTEPSFIFVIMALCSTKPILDAAENAILWIAHRLPFDRPVSFYLSIMFLGPLLGSFITEPAAMTVTALLLLKHFYSGEFSTQFKYATMAVLFINVSVGGTLTPYAAPPVLMVADAWGLDLQYMFMHFGLKGMLVCFMTATLTILRFRKEIVSHPIQHSSKGMTPLWLQAIHIFFLILIVILSHHMVLFFGVFLVFMAFFQVTSEYQEKLRLREGLLVALFLGSLIILSSLQSWWLEPLLAMMSSDALFVGAMGLSAFTDNAAVTYLGSMIPDLSERSQYALLAGAVCGGGLTVIANAPNPAGFSLLSPAFGDEGAAPFRLLKAAIIPTLIAGITFYVQEF